MSEAQRIGQLFVMGLPTDRLTPAEIAAIHAYHFGSVSFTAFSHAGVSGIRTVTDAVQAQVSPATTDDVRFFVAANQEGGEIQPLSGPGFSTIPSALDQGTIDPDLLAADAAQWGRELASAGINLDFAPVMDVVPPGTDAENAPIGALRRGYGHDPAVVAAHGLAFIRGMAQAGIATTAKHFPGLGRVTGNTDFTANVVDRTTTPNDPYLQPFRQAIEAGVPFVMVSLAGYTRIDPSQLAVFSPVVIRQLLRGRFHFEGVVISDELGKAAEVADVPAGTRAIEFLDAGGDIIISKPLKPAVEMYAAVLSRTEADPSFLALVNDAVRRVLRAKQSAGLLPCASA